MNKNQSKKLISDHIKSLLDIKQIAEHLSDTEAKRRYLCYINGAIDCAEVLLRNLMKTKP